MTGAEAAQRYRDRDPGRARNINLAAKRRARQLLADHKAELGCERCRIKDPRVLDLHHRDPAEKASAVSQLLYRTSLQKVLEEAAKCRVLCANCHRIEHAEKRAKLRVC